MSLSSRKLHIRGGLEHLPKSISLVGEGARRAGLPASQRDALEGAAREAYLAIAETSQREGYKGTVEVEVCWDEGSVVVSLVCSGEALDALFDRTPPDPRLQLMQQAVDEVRYVHSTRQDCRLSLVARIPARPRAEAAPPRRMGVRKTRPVRGS